METNRNTTVITQSPGKILVCGGYLIISPSYRGLIFNSDTYFKCEGKFLKLENYSKQNSLKIVVMSEVFRKTFEYELLVDYDLTSNEVELKINQYEGEENRFIEYSIINSFYFFFMKNFDHIETIMCKFKGLIKESYLYLILNADYRFYTFDEKMLTEFQHVKSKTGLGSSSGLICSLNTNIIVLLMTKISENFSLVDVCCINQMNKDDRTCILISAYFSNNQAQMKVLNLIIFYY